MDLRSIQVGKGDHVHDYIYVNMCTANIHSDHLLSLLDAEKKHGEIFAHNYIQRVQRNGMTEEWRRRAAQWSLNIFDLYGVNPENIFLAMSILDRYLSLESVDENEFKLVTLCSLFTSVKLNERRPLRMNGLLNISGHLFDASAVANMEWKIIRKLGWRLLSPSPMCFARCFAMYLNMPIDRKSTLLGRVKTITEMAICDYGFIGYPPSVVALAAILCSLDHERVAVQHCEIILWKVIIHKLSGLQIDSKDVVLCEKQLKALSWIALGGAPPLIGEYQRRTSSPTGIDEFEMHLCTQATLRELNKVHGCLTNASAHDPREFVDAGDLTASPRVNKRRRLNSEHSNGCLGNESDR